MLVDNAVGHAVGAVAARGVLFFAETKKHFFTETVVFGVEVAAVASLFTSRWSGAFQFWGAPSLGCQ